MPKNKKISFIILPVIVIVIAFSPYTIVKLTSYGQDLFSDNPQYQLEESQLTEYQKEEQAKLDEIAKIEEEIKRKEEATKQNSVESFVLGEEQQGMPDFNPATAPGIIKMKILLADGGKPDFSVRVKFIAVGEKTFETKTDKDGKIEMSLTSGRYYGEIIPDDNGYRLQGDGPAFFLNANSEKDLGKFYLIEK